MASNISCSRGSKRYTATAMRNCSSIWAVRGRASLPTSRQEHELPRATSNSAAESAQPPDTPDGDEKVARITPPRTTPSGGAL